jgi:hypothetical protein
MAALRFSTGSMRFSVWLVCALMMREAARLSRYRAKAPEIP